MTPPQDHFVAFVDRLAADLDAIPRRAEELAADAYLSRHHFERVITAIAGESPTRFRARILLERAAYRMTVSDATLLDVAVEAGFGSHEAFTRAFRREFGATPSAWRRRPAKFRIEAPNDVHFHPPAGLRLPARHTMSGMDLVVEMVEHHVWLVDQLVRRAATLTDEQLDDPFTGPVEGIDGETLRWSLSRLIGQMGMWCAAMEDGEYDFAVEQHESVASMRRRLAVTGPEFVSQVREVAHVLTFAAHHRLLAVAKLRELGITDLGFGDPKAWFTRQVSDLDQAR